MKIWKSFSGEHSAKLRIIGTFKTTEDAQNAESLFNRLLEVKDRHSPTPYEEGKLYSKQMLDFFMENNFSIEPNAIEHLDYLYPVKAEGEKIIFETDDWALQPLMQAMIAHGAKIELYSRHDYPIPE